MSVYTADDFASDWEAYELRFTLDRDSVEFLSSYYNDSLDHPGSIRLVTGIDVALSEPLPLPLVETHMSNEAMMTPLQCLVVQQVDSLFDDTSETEAEVRRVNQEIKDLTNRKHRLQLDLKESFIQLLCLVAVDVHMFSGRNHKVPLIKIHRTAYDCGLKESKEAVEEFVNKRTYEDIPF